MEKTRPILYGVADYAQIRKKNAFEEFFSGTDIALKPRLDRWPDIAHAALIEMKYVKAGDPAPTKEQLEKIKKLAPPVGVAGVSPATGTTGVPPVALHRLVLVFHGGECLLSEEV